ncbi:hypothetical protein [Novosphingobium sp. CECT 9465]|uniref:hypothetical protein n=1 Tax=Novosphingobium sp. CECT 9465 TaxID=2829794 RepID=UPI001E60A4DA|nr:hypothetical protein [Novosphingobium sp. CECT 9465]
MSLEPHSLALSRHRSGDSTVALKELQIGNIRPVDKVTRALINKASIRISIHGDTNGRRAWRNARFAD